MTTHTRIQPLTLHWLVVSQPDDRRPTLVARWRAESDPPRLAAVPDGGSGAPSPTVASDAA